MLAFLAALSCCKLLFVVGKNKITYLLTCYSFFLMSSYQVVFLVQLLRWIIQVPKTIVTPYAIRLGWNRHS